MQTGLDTQEPQPSKKSGKAKGRARRAPKYEEIDEALVSISEACPENHEEVFDYLKQRHIPIPNAEPFKSAGGWLQGFKQSPPRAQAWLSLKWGRLGLRPFARGPKK
jgi:hypothetical protein